MLFPLSYTKKSTTQLQNLFDSAFLLINTNCNGTLWLTVHMNSFDAGFVILQWLYRLTQANSSSFHRRHDLTRTTVARLWHAQNEENGGSSARDREAEENIGA